MNVILDIANDVVFFNSYSLDDINKERNYYEWMGKECQSMYALLKHVG